MTTTPGPRTYGGWRRARSLGVGGLDSRQTVMLMTAILIPLLAAALGALGVAVVLGGISLLMLIPVLVSRGGVLLIDAALARMRWQWATWRGETSYRASVFAELPYAWDLPGVLAPTTLLDVEEPGRGRAGIVWNQRTGHMSATLLLSPTGGLLADRAVVEQQVGAWGDLLAGLADDPSVRTAAVTIELIPEAGTQLADHVSARLDPGAPALARQVLGELVAAAPKAAARLAARLTLTVDPAAAGSRPRTVPEAAAETLRALNGLSLAPAGAEVLRRASATDVVRIVRTAFEPAASAATLGDFEALTWGEAGPVAAEDRPDHYGHDQAISVSWVLAEAPRQRISHDVLLPLVSPGRFPRRITLAYRVLSREEAGSVLEREVNAASAREEYRRRTRRDATARDRADAERASRSASEEAHGAGLVQFALYVTTTVADPAQLAEARREVEQAAGRSKLRLRPATCGQAVAFAAGLPCGIYPPAV